MAEYLLELQHVTKRFPGVVANSDVNLKIGHKKIVSIIGENGAGKSTLCKMLTGMYQPTEGTLRMDGQVVRFRNTKDSMERGISMVYQERNLVDLMTGAQNVCLNSEATRFGFINDQEITRRANAIKEKLKVNVDLTVPVSQLGAGEKQLVEIMRAIHTKPKLLILDEPTASLGEGEIEPFLSFIKKIKEEMDLSVIFISHKIQEVFDISDEIAVLTDGKLIFQKPIAETTQAECIAAMLRAGTLKPVVIHATPEEARRPLLHLDGVCYDHQEHNVQLDARYGEIVGIYGLVGAGRTEAMETIFGVRKMDGGSFVFDGETVTKTAPLKMIDRGMILTPEIRNNAIFKTFSLMDNICNLFLKTKLASRVMGLVYGRASRAFAEKVLSENHVKHTNIYQSIMELSGGNIQKVIIGRSINIENIKLLIVDEPTTGMDVGAKNEIYIHLRSLVEKDGIGVVFISSELEELMITCDRIYVFSGGDTVGSFDRADFDKATILETAIRGKMYETRNNC